MTSPSHIFLSYARDQGTGKALALREDVAVPILPVLAEPGIPLPFGLNQFQPVDLSAWDGSQLERLLQRIRNLDAASGGPARRVEIAYLQNLLHRQGLERAAQVYEPLAGDQYRQVTHSRLLPGDEMEMDFELLRQHFGRGETVERKPQRFDDVLEALGRAPRLVMLGEPGAGKTHSLKRIAAEMARNAMVDGGKPLPLFIPLREWIEPKQPLDDFLALHLDGLGAAWRSLLAQGRAALLLDGLNELPTNQRQEKMPQIRELAGDDRLPVVVASCRKADFDDHRLDLDRLEIRPLDEPRILSFCQHHFRALLGPEVGDREGERHFWLLAGGEAVRSAYDKAREGGVSFEQFWRVAGVEPVMLIEDNNLGWLLKVGERAKTDERSCSLRRCHLAVKGLTHYCPTKFPHPQGEYLGERIL
jgi:hypothetical protein